MIKNLDFQFNRKIYEGDIKSGGPWGNGTLTWKTGEKYVGQWDKGQRSDSPL